MKFFLCSSVIVALTLGVAYGFPKNRQHGEAQPSENREGRQWSLMGLEVGFDVNNSLPLNVSFGANYDGGISLNGDIGTPIPLFLPLSLLLGSTPTINMSLGFDVSNKFDIGLDATAGTPSSDSDGGKRAAGTVKSGGAGITKTIIVHVPEAVKSSLMAMRPPSSNVLDKPRPNLLSKPNSATAAAELLSSSSPLVQNTGQFESNAVGEAMAAAVPSANDILSAELLETLLEDATVVNVGEGSAVLEVSSTLGEPVAMESVADLEAVESGVVAASELVQEGPVGVVAALVEEVPAVVVAVSDLVAEEPAEVESVLESVANAAVGESELEQVQGEAVDNVESLENLLESGVRVKSRRHAAAEVETIAVSEDMIAPHDSELPSAPEVLESQAFPAEVVDAPAELHHVEVSYSHATSAEGSISEQESAIESPAQVELEAPVFSTQDKEQMILLALQQAQLAVPDVQVTAARPASSMPGIPVSMPGNLVVAQPPAPPVPQGMPVAPVLGGPNFSDRT